MCESPISHSTVILHSRRSVIQFPMFRQHATSSQACVTFSQCSQISYLIVDSFFLLLLTALLVTHPFSPFALRFTPQFTFNILQPRASSTTHRTFALQTSSLILGSDCLFRTFNLTNAQASLRFFFHRHRHGRRCCCHRQRH